MSLAVFGRARRNAFAVKGFMLDPQQSFGGPTACITDEPCPPGYPINVLDYTLGTRMIGANTHSEPDFLIELFCFHINLYRSFSVTPPYRERD